MIGFVKTSNVGQNGTAYWPAWTESTVLSHGPALPQVLTSYQVFFRQTSPFKMEDLDQNDTALQDLFRQIDSDGSKSLSYSEVILFLKSITDDISDENLDKIFANLDQSGDRSVDFEEFKVTI